MRGVGQRTVPKHQQHQNSSVWGAVYQCTKTPRGAVAVATTVERQNENCPPAACSQIVKVNQCSVFSSVARVLPVSRNAGTCPMTERLPINGQSLLPLWRNSQHQVFSRVSTNKYVLGILPNEHIDNSFSTPTVILRRKRGDLHPFFRFHSVHDNSHSGSLAVMFVNSLGRIAEPD